MRYKGMYLVLIAVPLIAGYGVNQMANSQAAPPAPQMELADDQRSFAKEESQIQVVLKQAGEVSQFPPQKATTYGHEGSRKVHGIRPERAVRTDIPRIFWNRRFGMAMPEGSILDLPKPCETLSHSDLEEILATLPEITGPREEWTAQQRMLVDAIERRERMFEGFLVKGAWHSVRAHGVPVSTDGFLFSVTVDIQGQVRNEAAVLVLGDYLPRKIDVPLVEAVASDWKLIRIRGCFRHLGVGYPRGWVFVAKEFGIRETTLSPEVPLALLAEPAEMVTNPPLVGNR